MPIKCHSMVFNGKIHFAISLKKNNVVNIKDLVFGYVLKFLEIFRGF